MNEASSECVSPVSPDPPVLPPIPQITSQRSSFVSQPEATRDVGDRSRMPGGQGHNPQDTSSAPALPRPNTAQAPPSVVKQEQIKNISSGITERPQSSHIEKRHQSPPAPPYRESSRTSGKPKRPIDVAFENMRSYSEPPFRQSIMMPPGSGYMPSQPYHQPPRIASSRPSQFAYHTQGPSIRQRSWQAPPSSSGSMYPSLHLGNRSSVQVLQQNASKQKVLPTNSSTIQDPPTQGTKSNKTKLNLKNPLSLLARRRSSQVVAEAYSQTQHVPAAPLRDDFDPRIRGKVVHDFSAPRPGRSQGAGVASALKNATEIENYLANPKRQPKMSTSILDEKRPASAERDHAPLFKEHFDDGPSAGIESPAKRRSTAFMSRMSSQESQPKPDRSSLPVFARNLPTNFASSIENIRQTSSPPPPKAPLEAVPESSDSRPPPVPTPPKSPFQQSGRPSSPSSPPITRSRGSSINDQSFQGIGSPKRFKSNASRFSFDLAGVGSAAQEKLLEDKHRQHASRKQRDSVLSLEDGEEMSDDNGYDEYMREEMEDDGFEEIVPGVNADEDDLLGSQLPVAQEALENVHIVSPNKSSFQGTTSPVSTGLTSPGTPCDFNGQAIGFSVRKYPGGVKQVEIRKNGSLRPRSTPGDKSNSGLSSEPLQRVVSSDSNLASLPKRDSNIIGLLQRENDHHDDDDLYFQDGFDDEDLDVDREEAFDETVFDDNSHGLYGLPLRDRTLRPLDPENSDDDHAANNKAVLDACAQSKTESLLSSRQSVKSSGGLSAELRDALTDLAQPNRPTFSHTAGLTQDNLAAYDQNALALATIQAAQNGKFDRANSIASKGAESDPDGIPLDLTRTGSQMSQPVLEVPVEPSFGEDAEDDDDIVAAANAEALENDDDGFYGQEFGFFAGPASGSSEAEYANGGYFGARSLAEGVHRSHSGRDAGFQEPSLTPITERSEWSNRNSTISLAHWGHPISTPGFGSEVQLANMMHLPEEGMTLEALMKLRRTAFGGGSSTSLHSSSNSNNSPVTTLAPAITMSTAPSQQNNDNLNAAGADTQNLTGSLHSEFDSSNGQASSQGDSDPSPSGDSPTVTFSPASAGLTMASPSNSMGPPPLPTNERAIAPPQPMGPPPPVPPDVSPKRRSAVKDRSGWTPGHSRNSSGAESVSYKEEGGKWILEKRRVGDGGEVEVVGRTFVEGGRI